MSDDNDDLDEQFDHESFKPSCHPSSESIIGGYAVARTAEQKTRRGRKKRQRPVSERKNARGTMITGL